MKIGNDPIPDNQEISRHNLIEALRTVRLVYQDIADGYRFDDDMAAVKLKAFDTATQTLDKYSKVLIAQGPVGP